MATSLVKMSQSQSPILIALLRRYDPTKRHEQRRQRLRLHTRLVTAVPAQNVNNIDFVSGTDGTLWHMHLNGTT